MRFAASAVVVACLLAASALGQTGQGTVVVHADQQGHKIGPNFFGLMTEEINHAYDGGLYAELIRNRDFKDERSAPVGWTAEGPGVIEIDEQNPVPQTALTRSLKITASSEASPANRLAVVNEGFWGVPLKPHQTYTASLYAKAAPGFSGRVSLSIEGPSSAPSAKASVGAIGPEWRKYQVRLGTGAGTAAANGRFKLLVDGPGTIYVTQVSVFPPTFRHRANGDRVDLTELLIGMKPSFLRLPGGNYLEGDTIAERFDWKATIGDISQRPGHQCPWGYRSSDGLGLYEYLGWCDDVHMQPLLAVYAGYSLRGEHVNPGEDLKPYVQDALDEIEFVTGGTNTKWGAVRAKLGHPRPWRLDYVEIGNEDNFDRSGSYDGRYAQFYDAIKGRYPSIQLIATARVRTRRPDVIDDHYYRTAAAMARDAGHYDDYDRKGPKIFVGEWASIEGRPTPNYKAALGDAAWLTGLERDSDVVVMESYAPLFVNVNRGASQWPTNLIGYDDLQSFGSPSYYVQAMFGNNTGDVSLPTTVQATVTRSPEPTPHGAIGLGTWVTDSEYKDVSVEGEGIDYHKDFGANGEEGWKFPRGTWKIEDGAARQTTLQEDTAAIGGDPSWTDYTLHLKAKKLGGNEGFLVRFHVHDVDNYWQWNVGGWGNSRTTLQRIVGGEAQEVGRAAPVTVETGKWYDIRIHVAAGRIECYLDDKLVSRANETSEPFGDPVYAAVSKSTSNGEIILKIVNVSEAPVKLAVELQGVRATEPKATAWEMTGTPLDQNSIAAPAKVSPRKMEIDGVGSSFSRVFPAYSVTVIRIKPHP